MERPIRTSAKAVIIRDGRLLAVRLQDDREQWYILPGGGQDAEELLPETVTREVREETGVACTCKDLLFVIEGRYGESFHRVDLVFEASYDGEDPNAEHVGDHQQTGYAWLDIATLNTAPLYPSRLRRPIMNFYAGKPYPAYLGNEEMGDPEDCG